MTPALAAIALGSNLGDRLATLNAALEALDHTAGIRVQARSGWYETQAVTSPEATTPQPDYLNGCALLQVSLSPLQLLEALLRTEAKFGRIRRERWGARTLDLDLLLFDDLILDTPKLQIPHPRMNDRAFVLVPLAEIAPDWIDPITGKSIDQLRQIVNCSEAKP